MSLKKAQKIADDVNTEMGIYFGMYQLHELEYLQKKIEEFLDCDVETEELDDDPDLRETNSDDSPEDDGFDDDEPDPGYVGKSSGRKVSFNLDLDDPEEGED